MISCEGVKEDSIEQQMNATNDIFEMAGSDQGEKANLAKLHISL